MTRLFESRHFSIAMVLATRYLIARLRYSPHASLRSAPHRFASLIQDTDTRKITRHTYSSSQHIATSHAGKLALARQADKLVLARPVLSLVLGAAIDKAATAAAQRQFAFALATLRTCAGLRLTSIEKTPIPQVSAALRRRTSFAEGLRGSGACIGLAMVLRAEQ